MHVDNKKKYILVLDGIPTQRLDDTAITAELKYSIKFTESRKRFASNLHYNGSNNFLFINAAKNISIQSKRL